MDKIIVIIIIIIIIIITIIIITLLLLLCYRHYLVVKYKDKPLEFWDLKTLSFLREMVSNPPSFSCIEWTPSHRSKSKVDHTVPSTTMDFDMAMGADTKMALAKEYLTVMDSYGSMWQITIEGSKVKVVNSTPTQVRRKKHLLVVVVTYVHVGLM